MIPLGRLRAPGRGDSISSSAARATMAAMILAVAAAGRATAGPDSGILRAGAATSNITPALGTSINGSMRDVIVKHVHDELHVRSLVLDNGEERIAFATVDSCMIPREICDAAKSMIERNSGIAPDHILISATHTHSAGCATPVFQSDPDPDYQEFLISRIAEAVQRAAHNLEPAQIAWGSAQVPDQVFNRRWTMKAGAIGPDPFGGESDRVKMNPPRGSEDLLEPAGPIDPEVYFLSVQSSDGRPIALLANYSLHYVGGVGAGHVSADYYGMFADRMQELLGADRLNPPFVAIMTNGTSGDINNVDFRVKSPGRKPYEQMRLVADRVSEEVFKVYPTLEYRSWVSLGTAQKELDLGVRLPDESDVERAESILANADGPDLRGVEQIYARETVLLARRPAKARLILQAIRIGDARIAAIPCEVFVEIGLEIKKALHPSPAFTIELANGYNGYLPTARQHALGGYETWRARSSYLDRDAADIILSTLLELFERLADQAPI